MIGRVGGLIGGWVDGWAGALPVGTTHPTFGAGGLFPGGQWPAPAPAARLNASSNTSQRVGWVWTEKANSLTVTF